MVSIVELRRVNIYQSGNLVLSNVDLNVNQGEFVYMIGKTGTGKSSLLKNLYGELPLVDGEGSVAGFNLREINWK
ncbi:MAG: ATP-binding cassette domain-containing protein, partial [Bacteroidota bacterium]